MSDQRRRRWGDIVQMVYKYFVVDVYPDDTKDTPDSSQNTNMHVGLSSRLLHMLI